MPSSFKCSLSFEFSYENPVSILLPRKYCMPRPSDPPLFEEEYKLRSLSL